MKKLQTLWETSSKFQKQSKLKAAYMGREEFKDSDPHKGFFCYNCIYRMDSMGEKCMIVDDKGPDILGNISDVIAPHGWRNGYKPNYKKIEEGT